LIATFLLAAGVVACSTDDLTDTDVPPGFDDGASDGTEESVKVDGSAEAKLTLVTGATLTVPKGAVDHDLTITVARPSDEKSVALVKTLKSANAVASAPYVLTPHGTMFKSAVSLEVPVSKEVRGELLVAWLENEQDKNWKVLSTAKAVNGMVTVELKHFSVIVILDKEEADIDASVLDGEDAGVAPLVDAGTMNALDGAVPSGRDAGWLEQEDASAPVDDDAGDTNEPGVGNANDASAPRDDAGKYDDAGYYPDAAMATDAASGGADASVPPDYDASYPDGSVPRADGSVPRTDGAVPKDEDAGPAGDSSTGPATPKPW
jgi:hypothetical protein